MTNITGIKGLFIGQPTIDGGNFTGSSNVFMPIYFKFGTCVSFILEDLSATSTANNVVPDVDTTTANAYWVSGMTQGNLYNWMALGHG
jgi:hypothetical protein